MAVPSFVATTARRIKKVPALLRTMRRLISQADEGLETLRQVKRSLAAFDASCLPIVATGHPALDEALDPSLYVLPGSSFDGELAYPERPQPASPARMHSCLCTARQFQTDACQYWLKRLHGSCVMHRKLWEHFFICQALYERGLLTAGRRGLGFAVGQEALSALFASFECEIVATDLDAADPAAASWISTAQHAQGAGPPNPRNLCDPQQFTRLVSYRSVDMNDIPDDLAGFDFTWSCCSFEHCGSIELGQRFIWEQMKCLKPGGIAVHTTEFNLSSTEETVSAGPTVLFRRRDIEAMIHALRAAGHRVEPIDLDQGSLAMDHYVDSPPWERGRPHLKMIMHDRYVVTCIGLIIQKCVG